MSGFNQMLSWVERAWPQATAVSIGMMVLNWLATHLIQHLGPVRRGKDEHGAGWWWRLAGTFGKPAPQPTTSKSPALSPTAAARV